MSAGRFNRCGAALVALVVIGGSAIVRHASGQAMMAAPATQPTASGSDIDFGRPPRYPSQITPVVEGGQLLDSHHGEALILQEFAFNPMTREIGLAKNSPGKQRIYADSKIDSGIYNTDLTLFDYLTTDRAPIGKIILTSARKKVTISPIYVVSFTTSKPAPSDPSSYRASVQFVKGEESNKPGTTVTVKRNADAPTALADAEFTKISRKTDVITWTVERGGAVVKTGSFGFPVVATEPDLVKYVIQLP